MCVCIYNPCSASDVLFSRSDEIHTAKAQMFLFFSCMVFYRRISAWRRSGRAIPGFRCFGEFYTHRKISERKSAE